MEEPGDAKIEWQLKDADTSIKNWGRMLGAPVE